METRRGKIEEKARGLAITGVGSTKGYVQLWYNLKLRGRQDEVRVSGKRRRLVSIGSRGRLQRVHLVLSGEPQPSTEATTLRSTNGGELW